MSEERDDIIVLQDDNGNEVEFEYLETVEVDGKEYVVLLPLEEAEKEEVEEVLILRVEPGEGDEDLLTSIEDEEELAKAFDAFKEQTKDYYEFEE